LRSDSDRAMADGLEKEAAQEEPGDRETVEKPKERESIFRAFVGSDEASAMEVSAPTGSAPDAKSEGRVAAATVPAKPAVPRKYGQTGLVAMLRKEGTAGSASLLPENLPGPAKAAVVEWREPVLGESEDESEGDDEADDEDEDEEEDDDDDEEEEEEEEEDGDEDSKPTKKKSLNDVQSIKKNTLRLGTLDAGYLR
jgi:hypothetical protein